MNELTFDQIMMFLAVLIEEGRITIVDGKLFVDDTLAMDLEAANVVEEIPEGFDQWGISHATSEFGGVSFEQLNGRLEMDRKSNDPIVAEVAKAFPQFFFMNIDRGLSREDAWHQLNSYNKQSWVSAWLGGGSKPANYMSAAYKWSSDKFVNKLTGDPLPYVLRLTDTQHHSKEWEILQSWYHTDGKLENYLTYAQGIISGEMGHPSYESEYLAEANTRAIRYYELRIAAKRRIVARSGGGSTPPGRFRPR